MRFLWCVLLVFVMFSGGFGLAAENEEIEYLLAYIESSGCVFVRNGKEYQAGEAREHLAKKYRHVKRHMQTAEDFIDRIASRSSISGRQYTVRCDGIMRAVEDWLHEALAEYRALEQEGRR